MSPQSSSRFDLTQYARQAAQRMTRGRTSRQRQTRATMEPMEGRQLMTVSFNDAVLSDIPSLYASEAVVTGDFNGDNKLDAAVLDRTNHAIYLLNGKGDGSFQSPITIDVDANPRDMVAGDFNGDGKVDLAVTVQRSHGNDDDDSVNILLGNGDNTFKAPIVVSTDGVQVWDIATADLNGDNKADLVVGHEWISNSKVGILLGTGDGHFGAMETQGVSSGVRDIAIGDINNDGKADIVAVMQQKLGATLINNGDGTFGTPTEFTTNTTGRGEGVVIGNFAGDGNVDLAIMSEDGDDFGILTGNGNGTFNAPVVQDNGSRNDAIAYDFDGDGDLDIVTTSGFGNQFEAYTHQPGGANVRTMYDFPGWNPYHLAKGDFNGDGRMDVVTTGEHATNLGVNGQGFLGIYLNTSNGPVVPPPSGGGEQPPPPPPPSGGGEEPPPPPSNGGGETPSEPVPTPSVGTDLAISDFNIYGKRTSFIGGVGKSLSLTKFKNTGNTTYKGPLTVQWFASADNVIDPSDTLIATKTRKHVTLRKNQRGLMFQQIKYPDVADGQYNIIAQVVTDGVSDSNSANNVFAAANQYTIAKPYVDLSGWFKTTPTILDGKARFAGLTIKNDGNVRANGPLAVKYYLSTDGVLDASDTQVGALNRNLHLGSAKAAFSRTKLAVPEGTAAGEYFLIAAINTDGGIVESTLGNNQAFSATPITVA